MNMGWVITAFAALLAGFALGTWSEQQAAELSCERFGALVVGETVYNCSRREP